MNLLMTHDRYRELGGTAGEQAFTARMLLTQAEFRKLSGNALPEQDTLEICIMMMQNAYEAEERAQTSTTVSSYSNDGVSVSYAAAASPASYVLDALAKVRGIFSGAGVPIQGLGVWHRA